MEILPISIDQTIDLLLEKLSDEEKQFISQSSFDELKEFGILDDLDIDGITALSMGNRALLEECSMLANDGSEFVMLVSIDEAIQVITEQLLKRLTRG